MEATRYTERVDEWGVGCVALELLLGASPFKGKPDNECTCPDVSHYNYNSDQASPAAPSNPPPRPAPDAEGPADPCAS